LSGRFSRQFALTAQHPMANRVANPHYDAKGLGFGNHNLTLRFLLLVIFEEIASGARSRGIR
jgi:hypothetical protein